MIKDVRKRAIATVATVEEAPEVTKSPIETIQTIAIMILTTIRMSARIPLISTRIWLLRITPIRRHTPTASPMRQAGTEYEYASPS